MKSWLALLLLCGCLPLHAASVRFFPGGRLTQVALQALQRQSANLPGQLEFIADPVLDARLDGAGDVLLEAGKVRGEWPRKRVGIPVRMRADAGEQTRMVWFTVRWWVEQPVYRAATRAGAEWPSVAWQQARIDAAGILAPAELLEDKLNLTGQRLLHAVRAGDPVRMRDFGAMPLVARQDPVSLHVRSGSITLTLPAAAIGDAGLGDLVKVMPAGGRTPLTARVVGKGEVRIEP